MRAALRYKDFRWLLVGLVASGLGDSVMLLGLAIWAKTLTGSTSAAGLTLLTMTAPGLVAPLFGWLVDRFPRRPFLIAANLASAAVLTPLYLVRGSSGIWLLYAVGVLYGVSFIGLDAGLAGLLKEMLPESDLAAANGLLATVRQGLRLAGPLVGAALFVAIGPTPLVTIDLLSFLVAALALLPVRVAERPVTREPLRFKDSLTAGGRYLFRDGTLRRTVAGFVVVSAVFGAIETLGFAYVDQGLHRPPSFIGVMVTVQATGGLLGGFLAVQAIRRGGELAAASLGVLALGVGMALLVYPSMWLVFVAMPALGLGLPMTTVAANTLIQRRTPAELIGRVWTVTDAFVSTPWALSIAASAVLVSIVDYRLLLSVIAAVLLGVAVVFWSSRRLAQPELSTGAPAVLETVGPG